MRIETYTAKYFKEVAGLVENFHKEAIGAYDDLYDVNALMTAISNLSDEQLKNAFLLIIDDVCQGIFFGMEYQSMTSGKRIFQELIWYVNEKFRRHGVRLLRKVDEDLKARGINLMITAVLENSKTEKIKSFYERMGYRPMEVHYIKSL